MPSELDEKRGRRELLLKQIGEAFEGVSDGDGLPAEKSADVTRWNDELIVLVPEIKTLEDQRDLKIRAAKEYQDITRTVRTVPHAGGATDQAPPEQKSLGDLFLESRTYTEYNRTAQSGPPSEVACDTKALIRFGTLETKTLFQESAGYLPQAVRIPRVEFTGQQQPVVADAIPNMTTTQIAVVFMQETTYTNAAAEIAEGAAYPESAFAFTEVSSPVRKIAVILPVTDEQLADVEGMRDMLNSRLTLQVGQRLDQEILNGNGTPPNLLGFLTTPGIQTQARGADPGPDALLKAITKLQSTPAYVSPSAIIMSAVDWQNLMLLKDSTGRYIFGGPQSPTAKTMWGVPVITTSYIATGTALVGDFAAHTALAVRAGLEFDISNAHVDTFGKGIQTIRAQIRVAVVTYRANALCSVTGL